MEFLRQPGNPCLPSSNPMDVSTPSFVPTSVAVDPILGAFLFHQDSHVPFHRTVLSLAKRVRCVSVGHILWSPER